MSRGLNEVLDDQVESNLRMIVFNYFCGKDKLQT